MTTTSAAQTTGKPLSQSARGADRGRFVSFSSALGTPLTPFAAAVVVIGILSSYGIGDVAKAVHTFPFDIPAIYLALEVFTAMVIATGIGDKVAVKLATASGGRRGATAALSVVVLITTCILGNNLSHVGIILPILLILLSTLAADRAYLIGFFGLIMAIVNLAGAATPVGDFPALTIMASGITSFGAYLAMAFPIFGLITPAVLVLVYVLIFRRGGKQNRARSVSPRTGAVLLQARLSGVQLDKKSLAILMVILAGMFAGWVFAPFIPPWAIAWAGTSFALVLNPTVRQAVKLENVDLLPVIKISVFLGIASFVATTGVLEQIADLLQNIDNPVLLLIVLMLIVAAITSLVSAGPTAAVLLPVAQSLVVPGAALAGMGDLVAVAFAGAICAGSSMFLISATAGPLLSKKVRYSRLTDDAGQKIDFSMRAYLPYGAINCAVQLAVAMIAVLVLFPLWSGR